MTRVLFVNQSYCPDSAATAQYLTDLTIAFARSGHEVHVLCSDRDYLDHTRRHSASETVSGVHVHRVKSFVFPRTSRGLRYMSALSMNISFALRLLIFPRVDRIVVLTTPPLIDWLCVLLKGSFTPIILWAMDINPDQAIQTGWFRREGMPARILLFLQKFFLRRCAHIIVLDRYMKRLLEQKGIESCKVTAIPLWGDELAADAVLTGGSDFRQRHNLEGKFVVMYAGNHSVCHPLDTVVEATESLQDNAQMRVLFVGGGARYGQVRNALEEKALKNVLMLPYQPRAELADMLRSADVHLISMGEDYVGIVHPSKVYHLINTGRPIVLIGPSQSSVGDILRDYPSFHQVEHGDVEGLSKLLCTLSKGFQYDQSEQESVQVREISERHSMKRVTPRIEEIVMAAG